MEKEIKEIKTEPEVKEDTAVKKVKFELEVDTNVVDSGKNPYMHLIFLARAVDAWRIFPRIFLSVFKPSAIPIEEHVLPDPKP